MGLVATLEQDRRWRLVVVDSLAAKRDMLPQALVEHGQDMDQLALAVDQLVS